MIKIETFKMEPTVAHITHLNFFELKIQPTLAKTKKKSSLYRLLK